MARSLTDREIESVRAAYWDPFHPRAPVIGDPHEADCIWTQAFSRGANPKYNDRNLQMNVRILRRKTHRDDTETFRLLQEDGFDPGNANRVLARLGMELAERYGKNGAILHDIAQWEIPYVIYAEHREWYKAHEDFVHPVWPPYVGPTPNVKQGCIRIAKRLGLSLPIELAPPVMLARAITHIWALGWDCVTVPFEMSFEETFAADSCQYQTRRFFSLNPFDCWLPRETYGRFIHFPVLLPVLRGRKSVAFSPPNRQFIQP